MEVLEHSFGLRKCLCYIQWLLFLALFFRLIFRLQAILQLYITRYNTQYIIQNVSAIALTTGASSYALQELHRVFSTKLVYLYIYTHKIQCSPSQLCNSFGGQVTAVQLFSGGRPHQSMVKYACVNGFLPHQVQIWHTSFVTITSRLCIRPLAGKDKL